MFWEPKADDGICPVVSEVRGREAAPGRKRPFGLTTEHCSAARCATFPCPSLEPSAGLPACKLSGESKTGERLLSFLSEQSTFRFVFIN